MDSKQLSIKTPLGSRKLLAILIVVILLCSCLAQVISSNCGKVKVENITIDSRGSTLAADLYYPSGTNDETQLPALVIAHGAGVTKGNMRGIAEEFARRGFIVLNVNGYGTGLSEMPAYDENDMGVPDYQTFFTPSGIQDALDFLRAMKIVDPYRVGLLGHSQGAMRVAAAAMNDCGYLSFNDIMINELVQHFGQTFSREEIDQDADSLAEARLNQDQLELYNYLKEQNRVTYDTRARAVCMLGTTAFTIGPMATVNVGGFDVQRNCQINKCVILGDFDAFNQGYHTDPAIKESMHIDYEIPTDEWLVQDDVNSTCTNLGNIYSDSVLTDSALQTALQNRSTWISFFHPETHSKNFFSVQTTKDAVKYFEQVLGYNGGDLGSSTANPIDAGNVIFIWREILNGIAMLAMIGMLVVLASILFRSKFFASCVGQNKMPEGLGSSKRYWIGSVIAVVLGFAAIYYVNTIFAPGLPNTRTFCLFPSWWLTPIFTLVIAVVSIIQLIIYSVLDKKKGGTGLSGLNIWPGFVNVLKTILAAIILLAVAYFSLSVIKYCFNQDYRFWMTAFEEMKAEYWAMILTFAVTMFVQYLVIGAVLNYPAGGNLSEGKDLVISIIANSLGVWLCCLINFLVLKGSGTVFSNWTSSYGFLLFVPITVYISKRMYQITKSIWLGAATNSLLLSWMMISTIGYNVYYAQYGISNFFNI